MPSLSIHVRSNITPLWIAVCIVLFPWAISLIVSALVVIPYKGLVLRAGLGDGVFALYVDEVGSMRLPAQNYGMKFFPTSHINYGLSLPHISIATNTRFSVSLVIPLYILILFTILVWLYYVNRRIKKAPPWSCISCSYDIRGNQSRVCPECGTPLTEDQKQAIAKETNRAGPRATVQDVEGPRFQSRMDRSEE